VTEVQSVPTRRRSLIGAVVAVVFAALILLASLGVFSSHVVAKGTVISSITTKRYGNVLVVGGTANVGLSGFPLYAFSGDVDGRLGCGTTKAKGYDTGASVSISLTCTGPQNDLLDDVASDDWPALTTKAAPVAGVGVQQRLLGTIQRKGIGNQVTYAGHPLYLFDPASRPFVPQGEDFMETVSPLPPWHGYWYLVSSRTGEDAPGVAVLSSETLPSGKSALAVEEDANVDPTFVTLYDSSRTGSTTTCGASCLATWPKLLSSSMPTIGPGVDAADVAVVQQSNGLYSVTYQGRPLYLYAREKVTLRKDGRIDPKGSQGNGSGVAGPGGAMATVELIAHS
jgi:predicted lipoprotein with Yx(FWY)xxD motif